MSGFFGAAVSLASTTALKLAEDAVERVLHPVYRSEHLYAGLATRYEWGWIVGCGSRDAPVVGSGYGVCIVYRSVPPAHATNIKSLLCRCFTVSLALSAH